jgi:hypothetical protein
MRGYWIGLAGPFETYEEAEKFAEVAMLDPRCIEFVE